MSTYSIYPGENLQPADENLHGADKFCAGAGNPGAERRWNPYVESCQTIDQMIEMGRRERSETLYRSLARWFGAGRR